MLMTRCSFPLLSFSIESIIYDYVTLNIIFLSYDFLPVQSHVTKHFVRYKMVLMHDLKQIHLLSYHKQQMPTTFHKERLLNKNIGNSNTTCLCYKKEHC
jgi:hypothetical protein